MPRTTISGGAAAAAPRADLALTARGLITEAPIGGPAVLSSAGLIPPAGTTNGSLVGTLVGLRAGDTLTNLIVHVITTAGTALTFAKLGLLDSAGNTLAVTANAPATFNAGLGFKIVPLTAQYVVPANGGYFICFLQYGSGATGATLSRAANATATQMVVIGSGTFPTIQVPTLTDITGAIALAAGASVYWVGAS